MDNVDQNIGPYVLRKKLPFPIFGANLMFMDQL
jgi:hypothetical protein